MLIPIEAASSLFTQDTFTSATLDEAITAFNAELATHFAGSGQIVGIPQHGLSNVIKVETSPAGGCPMVTATVTLAVLTDDTAQVEARAATFTSARFPAAVIRVVTPSRIDHLRGLDQFAALQSATHQHATERIADILNTP